MSHKYGGRSAFLTLAHDGYISNAVWNNDESLIFSWNQDSEWASDTTFHEWNALTGEFVRKISGDNSRIMRARWSKDESQIMLTTEPGHILRYYNHVGDLITAACTRAVRNLTWSEWQQNLVDEPYHQTCPSLPAHPSVPSDGLNSPLKIESSLLALPEPSAHL